MAQLKECRWLPRGSAWAQRRATKLRGGRQAGDAQRGAAACCIPSGDAGALIWEPAPNLAAPTSLSGTFRQSGCGTTSLRRDIGRVAQRHATAMRPVACEARHGSSAAPFRPRRHRLPRLRACRRARPATRCLLAGAAAPGLAALLGLRRARPRRYAGMGRRRLIRGRKTGARLG